MRNYISIVHKIRISTISLNHLLMFTVFTFTVISTIWFIHQFCRLFFETSFIWESTVKGGIDLFSRHKEFKSWFEGHAVYGKIGTAVYPPASYVMLWPLLNWNNFNFIKILFSLGYLISLITIINIIVKESTANTRLEKVFIGLIPLAIYPAGASIGNGQINLLIFPFLLYGILLLKSNKPDLKHDIIVSFFILISLIKPNISAPFLWILLFVPGRYRPIIFTLISYLILTVVSLSFQNEPSGIILKKWESSIHGMLFYKEYKSYDASNILMSFLVKDQWLIPAAVIMFLSLCIWTYLHRFTDIWILIGVTAILTRLISYHRWYDDIIILIPIITLFRFVKNNCKNDILKFISIILLSLTILLTLAPGGFYLFPEPFKSIYVISQNIIYISVLVFLLIIGWIDNRKTATENV